MAVSALTTNYKFKLIDFDSVTWHDDNYDNWREVDALLFNFIQLTGVQGVWAISTAYVIGDRVIDGTDSTIWEVFVNHTSASSGTFAADRLTNPTYWSQIGGSALNEEGKNSARRAEGASVRAMAAVTLANMFAGEAAASALEADQGNDILQAQVYS